MKKIYIVLSLILAFMLVFTACKSENTQAEESETQEDSTPESESVQSAKFGGIMISDITEVGYHGEELKESAERIAEKLKANGAGDIEVFEGYPSTGAYAIELGCDDGDPRLMGKAENTAIVSSDRGWIFAAVKGDTFGHKYAANILENIIGEAEYQESVNKEVILHEAKAMESGKELTQIDSTTSHSSGSTYFEGTTVQNAIEYSVGDQIVFNIALKQAGGFVGCKQLEYNVLCDDGKEISGKVDGTGGSIQISTAITSPGFVRIRITAIDKYGATIKDSTSNAAIAYEGGAGADIQKLEQGVEEPEDFDEFWANQMARLDKIGINVLSKYEMSAGNKDYVAYDIQLQCVDGSNPASGVLTMPKDAEPKSLDAKMWFSGYTTAISPMIARCEPNTIVFSVCPHGLVSHGKDSSYYSNYAQQIGQFGFDVEQNKNPETSYFLNMILRDVLAARYILQMPEYNGSGIMFEAGSMGAMQSINVAARIGSENVKMLDVTYPWLSDIAGSTTGRMGPTWGPKTVDEDGNIVKGLLYFDSANNAKRITAPVKLSSRLGDYTCPPSGQVVLYKSFASTDKTMTFRQNATHSYKSPSDKEYEVTW